jgi:hypothetical protein
MLHGNTSDLSDVQKKKSQLKKKQHAKSYTVSIEPYFRQLHTRYTINLLQEISTKRQNQYLDIQLRPFPSDALRA